MTITVTKKQKVKIVFKGKINMSQAVELHPDDAKKLAQALLSPQSETFETQ